MNQKQKAKLVGEWYERWHGLVMRLISTRLNDQAEVQDLAQEVYMRLLRVDTLDLVRNPRAYLYRVAVNVAGEWRLRSRQSKPHTSEELDDLVSLEDLDRALDENQAGEAVRHALAELPKSWRDVLVLHCRDDMTYEQIAHHLGITRRQVKRYVAKGYAEMREKMAPIRGSRQEKVR